MSKTTILILNTMEHYFHKHYNTKALPIFEKIDSYGNAHSYTGMLIKMKRKSLGFLLGSYYYPTGIFALLSMISFLISPDIVSNV